jgi:hypothetical protein
MVALYLSMSKENFSGSNPDRINKVAPLLKAGVETAKRPAE